MSSPTELLRRQPDKDTSRSRFESPVGNTHDLVISPAADSNNVEFSLVRKSEDQPHQISDRGFEIAPNRARVFSRSELSVILQNLRGGSPAFEIGSGPDSISFIVSQMPVEDTAAEGTKPMRRIVTIKIPRREGEKGPAAISQFPADELVNYLEDLATQEEPGRGA